MAAAAVLGRGCGVGASNAGVGEGGSPGGSGAESSGPAIEPVAGGAVAGVAPLETANCGTAHVDGAPGSAVGIGPVSCKGAGAVTDG
jgi:hypothetical protein